MIEDELVQKWMLFEKTENFNVSCDDDNLDGKEMTLSFPFNCSCTSSGNSTWFGLLKGELRICFEIGVRESNFKAKSQGTWISILGKSRSIMILYCYQMSVNSYGVYDANRLLMEALIHY